MNSFTLIIAQLFVAAAPPSPLIASWHGPVLPEQRYVTGVPFTCVIGYQDWLASERSMTSLRKAPPDLLHVNQPVPIDGAYGLKKGFRDHDTTILSRSAYEEKLQQTKAFVRTMREAGVEIIIPYINSCIMLGDHERRTGFWKLYDRWDEVAWLLGPKPIRDPFAWCGVPRRSLDPFKPYPEFDMWRYEPSAADPDWRALQIRAIEAVADCGYDGVFIDDCIMASYSPVDQRRFADFVASRASSKVLESPVTLGRSGQGLVYAETVRYWQDAMTEHLEALRQAGQKHNPTFFIYPNWGSISRPMGLAGRETTGKSLETWSRVSRLIMLEENYGPGKVAPGSIYDYALQYKQCLALGVRPAILPYVRGKLPAALAYAEAAAGGGGTFVETSNGLEDLRQAYRAYYRAGADVLGGLRPWSQVALLYDTDESHYEHNAHITDAMKTGRALLDHHVQFDVIFKKDLNSESLKRYETVFLPNVAYLSDRACESLLAYVRQGGRLIATGQIATHDELARARPRHAWGLRPFITRGMSQSDRDVGKGNISYVADTARLIPTTSIDIESLSDVMLDGIEETLKILAEQPTRQDTQPHPYWQRFTSDYAENHLRTDLSPDVRIHVYQKNDLMTVHFVRYCVSPWEPNDSPAPAPLARCRVTLNLGESFRPKEAYALDAIQGRSEVQMTIHGGIAELVTRDLGFHRMLVLK